MLIAWHISLYIFVFDGYCWLLYLYITFSLLPPLFHPVKVPFFSLLLLILFYGREFVSTHERRWFSVFFLLPFSLYIRSPILCQRGFGGMNELYVRAWCSPCWWLALACSWFSDFSCGNITNLTESFGWFDFEPFFLFAFGSGLLRWESLFFFTAAVGMVTHLVVTDFLFLWLNKYAERRRRTVSRK